MSGLADRLADIDGLLRAGLEEHRVPGAAVAVLDGDDEFVLSAGTTRVVDGSPVHANTMFQVGSITKVVTATLVMQLVGDSALGLDDPVVEHLPGLLLGGDRTATAQVTVRHLLSHSAGIEGDHFVDFGRGDDAIERYVDSLSNVGFASPPGAYFSYCNSGFVVLGRLLEVVTGQSFNELVQSHLLAPLGLGNSVTSADHAILRSTAVGHDTDKAGRPKVASRWSIFPALAPAGATLTMSASDVLGFARLHLDSRTEHLERILPQRMVLAMREFQQPLPGESEHYVGLGWGVTTLDERLVLSHSGSTLGQHSLLHVIPDTGQAVVVLTNGAQGAVLADQVARAVAERLLGRGLPQPAPAPALPAPPLPSALVTGRYGCLGITLAIEEQAGSGVIATVRQLSEAGSGLGEPATFDLVARSDSELVALAPDGSVAFDLVVLERDARSHMIRLHGFGRVLTREEEA